MNIINDTHVVNYSEKLVNCKVYNTNMFDLIAIYTILLFALLGMIFFILLCVVVVEFHHGATLIVNGRMLRFPRWLTTY
jgi:hypothetical protein